MKFTSLLSPNDFAVLIPSPLRVKSHRNKAVTTAPQGTMITSDEDMKWSITQDKKRTVIIYTHILFIY